MTIWHILINILELFSLTQSAFYVIAYVRGFVWFLVQCHMITLLTSLPLHRLNSCVLTPKILRDNQTSELCRYWILEIPTYSLLVFLLLLFFSVQYMLCTMIPLSCKFAKWILLCSAEQSLLLIKHRLCSEMVSICSEPTGFRLFSLLISTSPESRISLYSVKTGNNGVTKCNVLSTHGQTMNVNCTWG